MLTAQRVRTSLLIVAAGAAVLAGVVLGPARHADPDVAVTPAVIIKQRCSDRVAAVPALADAVMRPRPRVALVLVLDTSGSSDGGVLADVQADAVRLLGTLGADDTVSIVTFSTRATLVLKTTPADADGQARAHTAIGELRQGGSTCISCGLDAASDELGRTPRAADVASRIVLVSDGQANDGLWDKRELVDQARRIGAGGTDVTTVEVGRERDADGATLQRIAEVGHGHYYPTRFDVKLGALFANELGALSHAR